jgi:hypothetical protein
MPKRLKQSRKIEGVNELAQRLVNNTTIGEGIIKPPTKAQISWLMAELGRKGGKKGGKRRLETMTSAERSEVARKAAQTRWKGH